MKEKSTMCQSHLSPERDDAPPSTGNDVALEDIELNKVWELIDKSPRDFWLEWTYRYDEIIHIPSLAVVLAPMSVLCTMLSCRIAVCSTVDPGRPLKHLGTYSPYTGNG
jgi:hypothetical protein